jgi:RNA polymerase sigma-70 factor (ECF subfamily)
MVHFMPGHPSTSQTLIAGIRDTSDSRAWATFLDIYLPIVLAYCRRRLQEADARDVAEQVILRIRKYIHRYEHGRGRFRGFLGAITRNEINRHLRKRRSDRGPQGTDPDGEDREMEAFECEPDLDWDRVSRAHLLESALERIRPEFDERQWQAFHAVACRVDSAIDGKVARWVENPQFAQVANELSVPVGWVYKVKCVILKRLEEMVLFLAEDLDLLRES